MNGRNLKNASEKYKYKYKISARTQRMYLLPITLDHWVGQRPDRVMFLRVYIRNFPEVWLCQGDQNDGIRHLLFVHLLESWISGNSAPRHGKTGEKGCICFGRISAIFDSIITNYPCFCPYTGECLGAREAAEKKRAKLSSRKSLDHSLFACYFRFHLILWNSFLIQMFSKSIASSCFLIGSAPHNEPLCCLLALDRLKPYLSSQNFIYSLCKTLFIVGHRWWDQPPENTSVYIQLKPL